ncbi:microfibrillar-associated 1 family protein [Aspergillus brunneoviolaceus CBS 621.78]|uniref:Uncharacterized protein n=1 Tax=Aspergillus brunneoviolaceus CBS 621.78 TaxID=1450534 RepID=A0ACD1GAS4_9EURO|nr:hypothetical protein BO95DRAFT_111048 [Aspergillus brunneoviolaceus CBS 621.78]RAH46395.1 hypothetical protein BO95DRAFT_111048 [Aspergillus brunneoviolaceus CBS 621.78]
MPPPLPSHHRGMTANPQRPSRYRPGKPIAEEPSSDDEDEEEDEEEQRQKEQEERRRREEQRRRAAALAKPPPKASSFPAGAAGVKGVRFEEAEAEEDEEGFVTEEEEDAERKVGGSVAGDGARAGVSSSTAGSGSVSVSRGGVAKGAQVEEESEEEESESESEEESSSEEETPRRVLLRPTFIKKNQRTANAAATPETQTRPDHHADSAADAEARRAQRQEKADALVREQLEKEAIARSAANRAWDDDELEVAEEEAIDDTDGKDPAAEYAAWKLRELRRLKRERETIEAAEKEREEIERRRELTAEEREREDRAFLARQKQEKEAARGQAGYLQRYFHKGAFFRDDVEREGLDQRNAMGARFVDDVARETLPEYMQIRDMTKLGKKGRTRYKDLRSEDTGRFGDGVSSRFGGGQRRREDAPLGVTDERFMPDERPRGPTGANASVVRERRRSRSRSYSPRRDRYGDRRERRRSRDRSADRYRPDGGSRRKRSPSPYDDREKRRRTEDARSD